MAAGDVFQLLIVWNNANTGENLSTRYRGEQTGIVAPNIDDLGDDVKAWWDTEVLDAKTGLKHYVTEDITLVEVTLQRIDPFEAVVFSYNTDFPIAGTDASQPGRPQDCVLVSMRTGKRGKSYRGRNYWPTPAEDMTDNGNLIESESVTLAKYADLLDTLLGQDGFNAGVYSTQHNKAPAIEFNEATNYLVDQRLRTQRRRTNRQPIYSDGS